jgi:hypothetical protein
MRLLEKDKRNVWVSVQTGAHDDVYTWGEATLLRAAVYPLGEEISASVYGDCVKDQRLLLYDGKEALSVGMGVSLDGGTPSFRIVKIESFSHTRAVLERIPEERRT